MYQFKCFQDVIAHEETPYDVIGILKAFDIPGAIIRGDWVNFCCPFHNDTNPSSGIHISSGNFSCYVCGHKFLDQFVTDYTKKTPNEAEEWMKPFLVKKVENNSINSLQTGLESVILRDNNNRQSFDYDFCNWVRLFLRQKIDYDEVEEILQQYDAIRLSGEPTAEFIKEIKECYDVL